MNDEMKAKQYTLKQIKMEDDNGRLYVFDYKGTLAIALRQIHDLYPNLKPVPMTLRPNPRGHDE